VLPALGLRRGSGIFEVRGHVRSFRQEVLGRECENKVYRVWSSKIFHYWENTSKHALALNIRDPAVGKRLTVKLIIARDFISPNRRTAPVCIWDGRLYETGLYNLVLRCCSLSVGLESLISNKSQNAPCESLRFSDLFPSCQLILIKRVMNWEIKFLRGHHIIRISCKFQNWKRPC